VVVQSEIGAVFAVCCQAASLVVDQALSVVVAVPCRVQLAACLVRSSSLSPLGCVTVMLILRVR
jgi:hypothetical protein